MQGKNTHPGDFFSRHGEVHYQGGMPTDRPIAELLRDAAAVLRAAGIEDAAREARLLLNHALGRPANALPDRDALIDPAVFLGLVARRVTREPFALITGRQGFWTLDLEVSPDTLIPRADTETLIEAALAARPMRGAVRRILDLGTGTGALLLAALSEYPDAFGVGIDLIPAAAALAARNAARNKLADRAAFMVADWAAPLAGRFDLILSNPPYIEHAAIAALMPEVAAYEPASALDGGADGLDAYRAIIAALPGLLAPGGLAVLEAGIGQAEAIAALGVQVGLSATSRTDLGRIDRAILLS